MDRPKFPTGTSWRAVAAAVALGLLLPGWATPEGIGDSYFPQDGNGGYDVGHYSLGIRYVPDSATLEGHAVLSARSTQRLAGFHLDFGSLRINRLTVNGKAASWRRAGDHELVVTPRHPIESGHPFIVDVRYRGQPAKDGAVIPTADGLVVAGEPHAATDWFPSNDHPRDKASYDFAMTVPAGLMAVANGVLEGTTSATSGWTTWHWRQRQPMATYLATVVVGRMRVVKGAAPADTGLRPAETRRAKPVVFSAVSESVPEERADAALARTSEIADFLTERFGPYPFDAIGGLVVDDPRISFALETQTRPIYGLRFFGGSDPDRKTTVIAHEIAHQWYGNSVSLNDWRDIWLNEGFATYGEWLWTEHAGIATVNQLFDLSYDGSDAMWSPPPGDPGPDNLFAQSVYRRGAMTLHALRLAVGDERFFRIMRGWATKKRYGNGTTSEFVGLAERVSGQRLDPLFQSWLYGTQRPPRPVAAAVSGDAPGGHR